MADRGVRPDVAGMEAALSAISQAHVRSDIAFAVAKKALDAMRQEGQGSLALLESAAKLQQQAVDRVTTSLQRVNALRPGELDVLA